MPAFAFRALGTGTEQANINNEKEKEIQVDNHNSLFYEQRKIIKQRKIKVKERETILINLKKQFCTSTKEDSDKPFNFYNRTELLQLSPFVRSVRFVNPSVRRKRIPLKEVLEHLEILIQGLDPRINDFSTVCECSTNLRKLLSVATNPPIDKVVNSNACLLIAKLINIQELAKYYKIEGYNNKELMKEEDDDDEENNTLLFRQEVTMLDVYSLQFECCWCLTNIASGTTRHTQYVVDLGVVPLFFNLLKSQSTDVRQQACWALGNIAGDSVKFRDEMLSVGLLDKLIDLLQNEQCLAVIRDATWSVSNCFRGKPLVPLDYVVQAMPILSKLILQSKDEEVLSDALWALSYGTDLGDNHCYRIQLCIESSLLLRKILEYAASSQASLQQPAIRIIGNIAVGNDTQTQTLLDEKGLEVLRGLISHPKKSVRKEVIWTISNIAGNENQIQAVIDSGLLSTMFEILRKSDSDIKKEATWIFVNAIDGGTVAQADTICKDAIVLIELFCAQATDFSNPKLVYVSLQGLNAIASRYIINNTLAYDPSIKELVKPKISDIKTILEITSQYSVKNNEAEEIRKFSETLLGKLNI
ncbi:hypothetical protein ABK040_005499 [Willaertia magna]